MKLKNALKQSENHPPMNNQIASMVLSMLGDDKINDILHGFSQYLIDYKNTFHLKTGESEIVLVLFDQNETVYMAVSAINDNNKIVRQIETKLLTDILAKIIKKG